MRSPVLRGLKNLREDSGLSQESVSKAIGITRMAYARYENDGATPNADNLKALASLFRVETWQLFHPDPLRAADLILAGEQFQTMSGKLSHLPELEGDDEIMDFSDLDPRATADVSIQIQGQDFKSAYTGQAKGLDPIMTDDRKNRFAQRRKAKEEAASKRSA